MPLTPPSRKLSRGFTLVELLIALAILAILTAVLVSNTSSFNDNLALHSAVEKVVLAFRQAEVEGLAVKENPKIASSNPNAFNVGYGIYFNRSSSNNSFVYFADRLPDSSGTPRGTAGKYDSGIIYSGNTADTQCAIDAECLKVISLGKGVTIESIKSGNSSILKSVNVVFERPQPEAIISVNGGSGASSPLDVVTITLVTINNKKAEIIIHSATEISVTYN